MDRLFGPPTPEPDDFTMGVAKKKNQKDVFAKMAFQLGIQSALNTQRKQGLDQQEQQISQAAMQLLQLQSNAAMGQQAMAMHMATQGQPQPQGPQEMLHYHIPMGDMGGQ